MARDVTRLAYVAKDGGHQVQCTGHLEARSDGWVNRDWVAGDLDQAGTYKAEVEITYGGGKKQT